MRDIMIELCVDRTIAESRKKHIKSLSPDSTWKTRIIENVSTAALFLTNVTSTTSNTQLKGQAEANELDVPKGAVLIMWTE